MNRRILIVGGHTGGHLYPAESLARELIAGGVGTPILLDHQRPLEQRVFNEDGMEKILAPWHAKGRFAFVSSVPAAIKLLRQHEISAVVGFGAFPSVTVGLAARLLRIPLYLHEQNRVMGLANRILTSLAEKVFLSSPLDSPSRILRSKSAILGCPIRPEFQPCEVPEAPLRCLILGGSQGADEVNTRVLAAADLLKPELKQKLKIVHMASEPNTQQVRKAWSDKGFSARVEPYLPEMFKEMSQSHLVISRAGASTLAELTAVGRGGVFLPYQKHADQHQFHNARYLEERGAGIVLESDATAEHFAGILEKAMLNGLWREYASRAGELGRPQAATTISEMIRIHLDAREGRSFSDRPGEPTLLRNEVEA